MLHRLALRVLPQLSLAVTEPDIRTRKRLVMFVVGFAAFAAYRLAKQLSPLADAFVVLALVAGLAALTSGVSYAFGRRLYSPISLLAAESPPRWAWLLGWVGAMYGMQLALLVLSLLQVGVDYDFLRHPDGPAMMAIIISCTAVARDAVEIGHLRWLESQGRSFLTFPDGGDLRGLLFRGPGIALSWTTLGVVLSGASAWVFGLMGDIGRSALGQLLLATLIGGTIALCAYLAGISPPEPWLNRWRRSHWLELTKFWWWPGLAFAATYFLVLYGVAEFVVGRGQLSNAEFGAMASGVGGLMALYCYYLGSRRAFEDRIQSNVPSSVLRCPFVTALLSKQNGGRGTVVIAPETMALPESHKAIGLKQT